MYLTGCSVVIPWHQNFGLLERAVRSVENQTIGQYEILIVCNGAGVEYYDEIRMKYSNDYTRVLNSTPGNANIARNLGIKEARHELICLLDCDDELTAKSLEVLLKSFQDECFEVSISSGLRSVGYGAMWTFPARGPSPDEELAEYFFCDGNFISSSAIAGRSYILKEILFEPTLKKNQDLDFIIRAQKLGYKIGYIKEPRFVYHDEHDEFRISKNYDFEYLANWGKCYPNFTEKSRLAFFARVIAQHQLPVNFFGNTMLIVKAAFTGSIPLFDSVFLVTRFLMPKIAVRFLQRYRARVSRYETT